MADVLLVVFVYSLLMLHTHSGATWRGHSTLLTELLTHECTNNSSSCCYRVCLTTWIVEAPAAATCCLFLPFQHLTQEKCL